MNLLSGLEKFGLGQNGELDILDDGTEKKKKSANGQEQKTVELTEKDFLLNRKVTCPICDKQFVIRSVKASKLARKEPDADLRPNHEYVDTLKYGVSACPRCGYAALNRNFEHLSATQRKWIRETITANFKPVEEPNYETYTYEYAVERYKLALVSAIAKKARLSEKAYICLNIAWLRRAQMETIPEDTPVNKKRKQECKAEYDGFYRQAYDGFMKVTSTETPPYNGMDANTVDYILANMAFYYKEYDVASKLVSRLLTAPGTPKRMKDKCLDLKDEIVATLKNPNHA